MAAQTAEPRNGPQSKLGAIRLAQLNDLPGCALWWETIDGVIIARPTAIVPLIASHSDVLRAEYRLPAPCIRIDIAMLGWENAVGFYCTWADFGAQPMGFIWNVLLSFSNEEFWEDDEDEPRETCESLERINQWIPDGKLVSLVGPTYVKGAGCGMHANLFGGGFKHFDIEGFIEVVAAQDWKDRANVRLWVVGAVEGMGAEPFTLVKLPRRKAVCPRSRPLARSKGKTPAERKPQRNRKAARRGRKRDAQ